MLIIFAFNGSLGDHGRMYIGAGPSLPNLPELVDVCVCGDDHRTASDGRGQSRDLINVWEMTDNWLFFS